MKRRIAFLGSLFLLACSEQSDVANSREEPSCAKGGEHQAILSKACIAGITKQVVGTEESFFGVFLDEKQNLFIQGTMLPDDRFVLEIPGPRYAQIDSSVIKDLESMGFRQDPVTGMFTMIVAAPALQDGRLEEYVLTAIGKLGFSQGAAIEYEVALLVFQDN